MKIINLVILIALINVNVFSSKIELKANEEFTSSNVIEVANKKSADLYNSCLTNFVPALKPASKLIWLKGERNGVTVESPESKDLLIVRHSIDVNFAGGYSCIVYNLKLYFKDGRYKCTIDDIILSHASAFSGMTTKTLKEYIDIQKEKKQIRYLTEVNEKLNKVMNLMETKMATSTDSDW